MLWVSRPVAVADMIDGVQPGFFGAVMDKGNPFGCNTSHFENDAAMTIQYYFGEADNELGGHSAGDNIAAMIGPSNAFEDTFRAIVSDLM